MMMSNATTTTTTNAVGTTSCSPLTRTTCTTVTPNNSNAGPAASAAAISSEEETTNNNSPPTKLQSTSNNTTGNLHHPEVVSFRLHSCRYCQLLTEPVNLVKLQPCGCKVCNHCFIEWFLLQRNINKKKKYCKDCSKPINGSHHPVRSTRSSSTFCSGGGGGTSTATTNHEETIVFVEHVFDDEDNKGDEEEEVEDPPPSTSAVRDASSSSSSLQPPPPPPVSVIGGPSRPPDASNRSPPPPPHTTGPPLPYHPVYPTYPHGYPPGPNYYYPTAYPPPPAAAAVRSPDIGDSIANSRLVVVVNNHNDQQEPPPPRQQIEAVPAPPPTTRTSKRKRTPPDLITMAAKTTTRKRKKDPPHPATSTNPKTLSRIERKQRQEDKRQAEFTEELFRRYYKLYYEEPLSRYIPFTTQEVVQLLLGFHTQHGTFNIPSDTTEWNKCLRVYTSHLRAGRIVFKDNDEDTNSKQLLLDKGFVFDPPRTQEEAEREEESFRRFYQLYHNVPCRGYVYLTPHECVQFLVMFHDQHGHFNIPQDTEAHRRLYVYSNNLRSRRTVLDDDDRALLLEKGFTFYQEKKARLMTVNEHIDAYITYKQNQNGQEPSKGLKNWMARVRNYGINITEEQCQRLIAAGFDWTPRQQRNEQVWQQRLEELKAYKAEFGDTCIPINYVWNGSRSLTIWVHCQRKYKLKGELRADRIQALNDIDFAWHGKQGKRNRKWPTKNEASNKKKATTTTTTAADDDDDNENSSKNNSNNNENSGNHSSENAIHTQAVGIGDKAKPVTCSDASVAN